MFTVEEAASAFGSLAPEAQAMISMRTLNSPEAIAAMAREVMRLSGKGIAADGSIGGAPGDADATVATLEAAFKADKAAAKTFEKAMKAELTREQRYEAMARTIYALGYAFDEEGQVQG